MPLTNKVVTSQLHSIDICKTRIHVEDGTIIKSLNIYFNDAIPAKFEVDSVEIKTKRRSEVPQERSDQVINHCVNNLSQAVQASTPNFAAL